MSLLEAARAAQVGRRGPDCTVSLQAPELVADINEALADPAIFGSTIAAILKDRDIEISAETINRHRRRGQANGCKCPV